MTKITTTSQVKKTANFQRCINSFIAHYMTVFMPHDTPLYATPACSTFASQFLLKSFKDYYFLVQINCRNNLYAFLNQGNDIITKYPEK